jgi:hypothetical protein
MSPKVRQRTIACLNKLIANSAAPANLRRAAVLRLARLKSAISPAPDLQSLTRGVALARETFLTMHAQRGALIRKPRRSYAENLILNVMLEEMPDSLPAPNADNRAWCGFVEQVSNTLQAIKDLPTKTIK